MAVQNAAVDERCRCDRLLGSEANHDVQVETAKIGVAWRPVDPRRRRMDEQRNVQVHSRFVQPIELSIVQRMGRIGADIAAQEAKVGNRACQFLASCRYVLDRERCKGSEAVMMRGDCPRQCIVVDPAEADRLSGWDKMEKCRAGLGEDLEVDFRVGPSAGAASRRP